MLIIRAATVWIWEDVNGEQKLTTECFENLVLMLPFTFLLFWTFEERIKKVSLCRIIWKGLKIAFVFLFTIEMFQLFLRLGTWQLSDFFYNTVGGGIGARPPVLNCKRKMNKI